ncbi:hypothetical protein Hanom_Chr12g01108551 [Helianthus anomalus]
MDGVKESDEKGKISNLLDPDAKKQTFGRKSQKWSKPQGRRWHFTLNNRTNLLRQESYWYTSEETKPTPATIECPAITISFPLTTTTPKPAITGPGIRGKTACLFPKQSKTSQWVPSPLVSILKT